MSEFPKINYDDYYKFIVSICVAALLIFIPLAGWLLRQADSSGRYIDWLMFAIAVLIIVFAIIYLRRASIKWRKNQDLLDSTLKAKAELAEIRAKMKKLALEKDIKSLAQDQSLMPDLIDSVKEDRIRKQIDS